MSSKLDIYISPDPGDMSEARSLFGFLDSNDLLAFDGAGVIEARGIMVEEDEDEDLGKHKQPGIESLNLSLIHI